MWEHVNSARLRLFCRLVSRRRNSRAFFNIEFLSAFWPKQTDSLYLLLASGAKPLPVNGVKHHIANEKTALLVFLCCCFVSRWITTWTLRGVVCSALCFCLLKVWGACGESGRRRRFARVGADKQGAGKQRIGGAVELPMCVLNSVPLLCNAGTCKMKVWFYNVLGLQCKF